MSILIIKSGTTSISGGTVKGDFTYFSATTKGLGGTIDTGFWSGVDPTCDGYTVYKIGGQHGWAAMVATGREQLNYYLQLFGGTGTTTDENVTWATNSDNIFIHTGSTGPCPTVTPTPTTTTTPTNTPTTTITPTNTPTTTSNRYYYTVGIVDASCTVTSSFIGYSTVSYPIFNFYDYGATKYFLSFGSYNPSAVELGPLSSSSCIAAPTPTTTTTPTNTPTNTPTPSVTPPASNYYYSVTDSVVCSGGGSGIYYPTLIDCSTATLTNETGVLTSLPSTIWLGPIEETNIVRFIRIEGATLEYHRNTNCVSCLTPTPTTTPTPTSTLVPGLGCSGGTISGTYSGNTQYTYPNQPISSSVDSYINFSWGSIDRPNRFAVYDSTGLLWTSGWVGFADYAGPWGASLNTPSTGNSNICFLSSSGRYVLVEAGNASPTTPITDSYNYIITCLGSCPGETSTPTPTPTSTPAGIQATIEFSFFDDGFGVVSARMEVTGGVTLDSLSWSGTGIGYLSLGCSGTENIQSFNDVLGIGDTIITTEVWGSISAILSVQNQTSSFAVNGNTINTVSQIITVGGHNYVINGVTDCFSPLT